MDKLGKITLSILQALWLPFVVYFGAGLIMILASGHSYVSKQWNSSPALTNRTALNMRWEGYDASDVAELWGVLDPPGLSAERRFLLWDLLFPLFYGGAFLIALRRVWTDLGKPFSAIAILAPVFVTVLADWTENLVQLGQLRLFVVNGKDALQGTWIQIASVATIVKLFSFILGLLGFLIVLAIWRGLRTAR